MENRWLKEALFSGSTANGFKLGTVLTLGWFWSRVDGCSVLYRGLSMEEINFDEVLAVTAKDADKIQPPDYMTHASSTSYFYVVQRVSDCGDEEWTLSAAAKVPISADGELAEAQPNSIFEARAEQVAGSKIQLVWYYCPVKQKSKPACFNVYYDNGTGQIDYENPVAVISYTGRVFYNYQSGTLSAGRYLFAVRVEDAAGIENSSLARLKVQIETTGPDAIDVLSAESI